MDQGAKPNHRRSQKITIVDIAREVGVSCGLVSTALSGRQSNISMKEALRQQIIATAKRLQYCPNQLARSPVSGQTMAIGLIVPPLTVPIEAAQVKEFSKVLNRNGYMPLIVDVQDPHTDQHPQPLLHEIQRLTAFQVDGIIIYQSNPLPDVIQDQLDNQAIPSVYIKWSPPQARNTIQHNSGKCSRDLLHHLKKLGHRSLQLVLSEHHLRIAEEGNNEFIEANLEFGLDLQYGRDWMIAGSTEQENTCYELVSSQLRAGQLPGALIFHNDLCAVAGMAALRDAGIRVPEDVSVVGQDDLILASMIRPALTTRRHPDQEKIAEIAFDTLKAAMNEPETTNHLDMEYQLVIRESTGPARSEAR